MSPPDITEPSTSEALSSEASSRSIRGDKTLVDHWIDLI